MDSYERGERVGVRAMVAVVLEDHWDRAPMLPGGQAGATIVAMAVAVHSLAAAADGVDH